MYHIKATHTGKGYSLFFVTFINSQGLTRRYIKTNNRGDTVPSPVTYLICSDYSHTIKSNKNIPICTTLIFRLESLSSLTLMLFTILMPPPASLAY